MRQKLGLATTLGARPAVLLGLLALTLLSVTCWAGVAQAQVYGNVSSITTGTAPWSPALGDLNGDGKLDLVVANYGDTGDNV
ncbi:MAG TPA: FG-GAP repeat protein, partial [Candidatus Methylomirabilis sp.]|nr:FG-GAP repeat protein [Candidatus Methylomirabilis sp.]